MSYPHHPEPPPGSYPYPPPTYGNESVMLVWLGQILTVQQQGIALHETVVEELRALPDRIAAKLPPPPPPPPTPTLEERLRTMREFLKLLVPLFLLGAIVMGKITLLEGEGVIRKWLGIG